jgi:hypothetical protein
MTELIRGRLTERIVAAASAGALVVGMGTLDDRVRGQITSVLTSGSSGELAMAGARVQRFARIVMEDVGYYGSDQAVLVGFALAALVLVLFMWRT